MTTTLMLLAGLLGALLQPAQDPGAERHPGWLGYADDITFCLPHGDGPAPGLAALGPFAQALASSLGQLLERVVAVVGRPEAGGPSVADSLERIARALERRAESAVSAIEPAALSRADAARFLGVTEQTIDQLIRERRIGYAQHGTQRGRVIAVADLRAFLLVNRQPTGEELTKGRRRA